MRKSECKISHKTLLQNNSADVPDNVITELKDDDHKEPSVTQQLTSYFNIFGAVEIYWINLTLRINGRSWHHQYERDTICHHQHERDTMINWRKSLSIRTSEVTEL